MSKHTRNPKRYIGVIGDMDPITHGGGIVYYPEGGKDQGPWVTYFQPGEGVGDWDDADATVEIYQFPVEDDVVADMDWMEKRWEDLARSITEDGDVNEIKEWAVSPDPVVRAGIYEAIGQHHGFIELDQYPETISYKAAERTWGRRVDAAHKAAAKIREKARVEEAKEARKWVARAHTAALRGSRGPKRNADQGDKDYHRRNLIVDRELVLRAMDWHGGQGSMVYSFASTGMENYVSPSMIDAAVGELEQDAASIKKNKDFTKADRDGLDNLIGDLDAIARFSGENSTLEILGEDKDDGYATWLMEENPTKVQRREQTAAGSSIGGAIGSAAGGPFGAALGAGAGTYVGWYYDEIIGAVRGAAKGARTARANPKRNRSTSGWQRVPGRSHAWFNKLGSRVSLLLAKATAGRGGDRDKPYRLVVDIEGKGMVRLGTYSQPAPAMAEGDRYIQTLTSVCGQLEGRCPNPHYAAEQLTEDYQHAVESAAEPPFFNRRDYIALYSRAIYDDLTAMGLIIRRDGVVRVTPEGQGIALAIHKMHEDVEYEVTHG